MLRLPTMAEPEPRVTISCESSTESSIRVVKSHSGSEVLEYSAQP